MRIIYTVYGNRNTTYTSDIKDSSNGVGKTKTNIIVYLLLFAQSLVSKSYMKDKKEIAS